ncbi:MAG TPA: hypothetical protein VHM88_11575, partial [Candidatus Acidoferrales bacterium]|nr:hypothetical protein [Candidatus Acidoferrales bacterium]
SRVLPTPPGPTRLTRRAEARACLTSASSWRRPMKLVASEGRFPGRRALAGMVPAPYYGLSTASGIARMEARPPPPSLHLVNNELPVQKVEVVFVGIPPAARVERASGVSGVEVDGSVLRCLVRGSFQSFLESLRGYEVVSLQSNLMEERQ